MYKIFFPILAVGNLRKNAKAYFPFIVTGVITVAMYYMVASLSTNESIESQSVLAMLALTAEVTAVFAFIFLFYTNSFLMKRRKLELGLYNILGMEKKHIALTIAWETGIIAVVSLTLGLGAGIALDKLMFLMAMRIMGGTVTLGFRLSVPSVLSSVVLFSFIFVMILLNSIRQIIFSKPVELLKGGQVGEKEPKVNRLIALIGFACLSGGYTLAITVKNSLQIINIFLIAVILVMLGTYCLFTAGSIFLLKLLRKNNRFYYQAKHFISVSGMIYRMKQNAVGLGNICILSTAVLVMVSTTMSLYLGMEDVLRTRYPQSVIVDVHKENAELASGIVNRVLTYEGLTPQKEINFSYIGFGARDNAGEFTVDLEDFVLTELSSLCNLVFVTLDDYNKTAGETKTLESGEVLFFTNRGSYDYNTLGILNERFSVKEKINSVPFGDILSSDVVTSHYVVVKDLDTLTGLQRAYEGTQGIKEPLWHRVAFDLRAEPEDIIRTGNSIRDGLSGTGIIFNAECRDDHRADFLNMYGSLFFIGIFLGFLFIMATVLTIYYKQINEGLDDKERFTVMKNVGLSRAEIKKTIRSQILTVFFLPLLMAGLHVAAAFPALTQLLAIFNLTNVSLFISCTIVSFTAFAVFYTLVYILTARMYFQIVR